jgi:glycosyltransferase involved in cell wall biosynthesis
MSQKIKLLCVPSDKAGCGLHRSLIPHLKIDELYSEEFDVTIDYHPNWDDLSTFSKYDIIHFHRGLYIDMERFYEILNYCKNNNVVTILDVDDYWDLNQYNSLFNNKSYVKLSKETANVLRFVDGATTTTKLFANKVKKLNKNVKVFPNTLNLDDTDKFTNKYQSDKIRFGFVMGSSHVHDMELLRGLTNRLPKDILDKIQFVLCGFDTNGTMIELLPNGETSSRPMQPFETPWFEYEKLITDGYKLVSTEYMNHLLRFIPNLEYPLVDREMYKRCWTKTVDNYEYLEHYNNVDVLLVPLQDNDYNNCKSELKFIEAGATNTAVIASNTGPYTIGSINFFEKGGLVNKNGNCILIDNNKAHKDWAKAIEKLVKNPEYITLLQNNMKEHIAKNYNINKITADRAEWYKELIKHYGKKEK